MLQGSAPLPPSQTRPDWRWESGGVLFNGATTNKSPLSVWHVDPDRNNSTQVSDAAIGSYPTWNRGLPKTFVTQNSNSQASPKPCNSVFDLDGGKLITLNIDGDAPPPTPPPKTPIFGGMPTVGPKGLPQIAFAGQPAVQGWAGSTSDSYHEDYNYIFLNEESNNVFTSAPMESGASLTTYDPSYQGRARLGHQDGSTIAFESNQDGKGYAIYLYNLAKEKITQVTDPSLGAQHTKFFPLGMKLILCMNHPNGVPPTRGIAWVDISGLLLGCRD